MASGHRSLEGADRRNSPRWYTPLQVRYGSGSELMEGKGLDISEIGIGFTGATVCPVGSDIEIRFKMDSPVAQWFRAKAVVRHVDHNRMGAEFVGLSPADRQRILEMIYRDIAARQRH